MVSRYDYLNIVFYLCFIVGVSVYFLRRSKNTSDYFRGGGILPWWDDGCDGMDVQFQCVDVHRCGGQDLSDGALRADPVLRVGPAVVDSAFLHMFPIPANAGDHTV